MNSNFINFLKFFELVYLKLMKLKSYKVIVTLMKKYENDFLIAVERCDGGNGQ